MLSIIAVTHNSEDDLPEFFAALAKHTVMPSELIVVDNASQDGTVDALEAWKAGQGPWRGEAGRMVLNKANLGYGPAANQGLALCQGDPIVFINPDVVVTQGWDVHLRAHFDDKSAGPVAAVGPVTGYAAGLQKMSRYVQALPDIREDWQFLSADALATAFYGGLKGQGIDAKVLIGFCFMVSREAIEKVGPFDPDLFLGNDDLDWSWRARQEGFCLRVAVDTLVFHKGQRSFQTRDPAWCRQKIQESTDALYKKLEKHFGVGKVPPGQILWDISWFTPSAALLARGRFSEVRDGIELTPVEPAPPKDTSKIVLPGSGGV